MLNKKAKNGLIALLATCLCVAVFGFATIFSMPLKTIADNSAIGADYQVQFTDNFDNGVLKEGWKEVSGLLSAPNGEWNFNGKTSVVFGDGVNEDQGKMLYDTGSTEYAFEVDVKYDNSININMHIPMVVTESRGLNAFYGMSVNLRQADAVFYYYNESGSGFVKRADTGLTARVTYSRLPSYTADWASNFHSWKIYVNINTIDVYVDGYYAVTIPRYEWTQDATLCGIAGVSSESANSFATIEYDNFTVWTKVQESSSIDTLFAENGFVDYGTSYASQLTDYDEETNTLTIGASAAFGNRTIKDFVVDDFSLSFKYSKVDVAKGISNNNGILFRASFDTVNNTRSGYMLYVVSAENNTTGKIGLRRLDKFAMAASGYTSTNVLGTDIEYTLGEVITITAKGSKITVTTGNENIEVTDTTYSSGEVGISTRTVSTAATAGTYNLQFVTENISGKTVKSTLTAYDTDNLFAAGQYNTLGTSYADYVTYDAESNTVTNLAKAEYEIRLSKEYTADVYMNLTISKGDDYKYMSANNGVFFRTHLEGGKLYGYAVNFNINAAGTTSVIRVLRVDGMEQKGAFGTESAGSTYLTSSIKVAFDTPVVISMVGSKITLTCGDATTTVFDDKYDCGYIGYRSRCVTGTGSWKMTFNEVLMEKNPSGTLESSEDNLTDYTVIDQNNKKQVYCLRNEVAFGKSYLDSDIVDFVNEEGKLTSTVTQKVLRISSYEVQDGASIRYDETTPGLRFKTDISNEDYQALKDASATVTYGIIMIPTQLLDGELTLETAKVGNRVVDNHIENGEEFNFIVSLVEIPEDNYGTEITARGYMIITYADGSSQTIYTDTIARSVKGVAQDLLNKEGATYSEFQLAILNKFAGVVAEENA